MCGIFGHTIINDFSLENSRKSLHTLTHRGPDQWGEWSDDSVYLGHRRLSILDLSEHGKQPMQDSEGKIIITVNGEIYNFKELRSDLEKKYDFKSLSDSEVVLYGYKEWGIDKLLEKIDGMYAFSIYDKEKRKLILARDRVGVKPLYYSRINDELVWASELKAIKKFYNDKLAVDNEAVYDFLTYLYIPTPKSLYKNVYKLEPAHYLELDLNNNSVSKNRYWELNVSEKNITLDEAANKLKKLIYDSVKEQTMSDVPLGYFLSGGLDSSCVVTYASKFSNNNTTYSIGFDVEEHNETGYAKIVAEQFATEHHEKILTADVASELLENLEKWYDEPFADTSAFPTFLVSEFAREKLTVVLTGDGGDEVFGGYKWYKRFEKYSKRHLPFAKILKMITSGTARCFPKTVLGNAAERFERSYLLDDFALYAELLDAVPAFRRKKYRKYFNIPEDYDDYWYFRKHYRKDLPLYTRLQYLDFHTYLPDDILTKVDRATMAVSLEARVPLLSRKIIEFMFSLPENIRYNKGELKGLMKYLLKDILPDEILYRKKKGFSIPLSSWEQKILKSEQSPQEIILKDIYNLLTK